MDEQDKNSKYQILTILYIHVNSFSRFSSLCFLCLFVANSQENRFGDAYFEAFTV